MISLTAEYALRAILYLARHEGRSLVTQEIAEAMGVPPGYMSKVLQGLNRAGLVCAQRGMGGGYRLARKASEISIYDVVHVFERDRHVPHRASRYEMAGTGLSVLYDRLDAALQTLKYDLKKDSIMDLLAPREPEGGTNPRDQRPATALPAAAHRAGPPRDR